MDKIYQEILEAIELKKENEAKIAELESKIRENAHEIETIENRINFSMNKDSLENQVESRKIENMEIENNKMNLEKQSLQNEVDGKINAIKSKLEGMIAEEEAKLEDNENKYAEKAAMERWNSFYDEELFENTQVNEAENKSFEMLDNIRKMKEVYNSLSTETIEKLAEEAKKNSEKLIQRNQKLQEEHIKETRLRICKDVFAKKEKGFEDILTSEYEQLKNSILDLVDKDPDKLRKVMYKISDMTLEDIYEDIIKTVKQNGNEDKAKNIAENLEKVKARREELNPKKDEPEKDDSKKDNDRRGQLERRLRRVFRAKEERFEDLIIDEYVFFKEDMFKLLDKDLDGLENVLNQMRNMKLSDIYRSMMAKAKEQGKENKSLYISEMVDKVTEREAEIKKEKEEKLSQEEELRDYKNRDNKDNKDGKGGKDNKDNKGKKPYEKTTIEVDTQHNKIVICAKGKTSPYKVSESENIKGFIKNGKEYKKDKQYKKIFDKKALKKVDPVILGILIDTGDMDAAKEYVNAFKSENASSIDLKYTFGEYYEANVPTKAISNYETYAKKAAKNAEATVEGLKKGPIGRFMDWRNARKAKKLEAAKEGKPTFGEKVQTYLFDEFGEERDEKIAGYKEAKQKSNVEHADPDHEKEQESKAKNDFKDEMSKGAPSPEKQAEKAKEFGEKEKAQKREPKARRKTQEEVK